MRALSVRQPHAEAIMRRVKKIEYRSRPTNIREVVYIYASRVRFQAATEAKLMRQISHSRRQLRQAAARRADRHRGSLRLRRGERGCAKAEAIGWAHQRTGRSRFGSIRFDRNEKSWPEKDGKETQGIAQELRRIYRRLRPGRVSEHPHLPRPPGDWYAVADYYNGHEVEFCLEADPGESLASIRKRAAQFSGQKASEIRVLKRSPS